MNLKFLLFWRFIGILEIFLGILRIFKGILQEYIYICIFCYDFIEIIIKKGFLVKRLVMLVEIYNEIYYIGNKQIKFIYNGCKDEV